MRGAQPSSIEYIMTLPVVETHQIPPEDRNCPVCQDEYRDELSRAARQLACGKTHLVCTSCLESWMDPLEGRNSCPYCRAVCFEVPSKSTVEGCRARSRAFDWLLDKGTNHTPGFLDQGRKAKLDILDWYHQKAAEAQYQVC